MNEATGSLLVVDDIEANRDMLARRLERKGYVVALASGGREAIEMIRKNRYDLVLLDIMMPDVSGLEVLRILRESRSPAELPVIMATAKGESADVVEGLKFGANDYVTKPLDFPVVFARVQTQLSLKKAVDQIKELEHSLEQRNRDLAASNSGLTAANEALASANARMQRDLKAAARIQTALLPSTFPDSPGVRFAWMCKPCAELAGDILNVFRLDEDNVGMYVLDVVGHGVAAALMAVTASRVLSPTADHSSLLLRPRKGGREGFDVVPPTEVAAQLNRRFPWDEATGQFFTLLYGVLHLPTRELRFVSAGHPGPIHLKGETGTALSIDTTGGMPIGLAQEGYEEQVVVLHPGDQIYLYSDGVPEAMSASREQFGMDRLLHTLVEGRTAPLTRRLEALWQEVDAWTRGPGLRDDVSLLGLEISESVDSAYP